jgi:PleD family two-component response regulator
MVAPVIDGPAAPAAAKPVEDDKISSSAAPKAKPITRVEDTLDAANELLANAARILPELRTLLQTLVKNPEDATRMKLLDEMYMKVHGLSGASVVGLSLISQMVDAFEALLKELRDKPRTINPSTLRTIASAVDFLEVLVKKGRAAEAQRGPAARILVVDDELLSRRAVTHALDRAKLPSNDVEDPLTALKLLGDNSYDLIFLDADMPGMNGFELCAKLRTLPYHKKTPVVFVTALNDFEARANSTMAGANDFIGKPFPFIELAVKALIYVLRGRVEARK